MTELRNRTSDPKNKSYSTAHDLLRKFCASLGFINYSFAVLTFVIQSIAHLN